MRHKLHGVGESRFGACVCVSLFVSLVASFCVYFSVRASALSHLQTHTLGATQAWREREETKVRGEDETEINLLVPEVLMIIALNAMKFFPLSCYLARSLPVPIHAGHVYVFLTFFQLDFLPFFAANAHVLVPLSSFCLRTFTWIEREPAFWCEQNISSVLLSRNGLCFFFSHWFDLGGFLCREKSASFCTDLYGKRICRTAMQHNHKNYPKITFICRKKRRKTHWFYRINGEKEEQNTCSIISICVDCLTPFKFETRKFQPFVTKCSKVNNYWKWIKNVSSSIFYRGAFGIRPHERQKKIGKWKTQTEFADWMNVVSYRKSANHLYPELIHEHTSWSIG